MKILPMIVALGTLTLSACEQQKHVNSWETPERLKKDCLKVESDFQFDLRLGKPLVEAKKRLSPCYTLEDGDFIELAKEKLVEGFKDPYSVQYEGVIRSRPLEVKGRYNAKNSYGAYVGYKSFTVGISRDTGKWYYLDR